VKREWNGKAPLDKMFFNSSYPGQLAKKESRRSWPWPAPNLTAEYAGRKVLPAVVKQWKGQAGSSKYTTAIEVPDGMHAE
jgi:hypothetical protein